MMNRAYAVLILILMVSISAYAQDEAEPLWNGDDSYDYLLPEMESEEEFWELDFDLSSSKSLWMDTETLCDILLEICIDLEVTDEEMTDMLPDLWEPDYDYELYWLWEDDWYYWEEE